MRSPFRCSYATVGAALLLLVACNGPPLVEVADLVAMRNSADIQLEPRTIDIGTAEARPHLRSGWSRDERNRRSGQTFVWSQGEESVLGFFLAWRRPLRVEFSGHPFQFEGAPGQEVAVELNGRAVARFEMRRGSGSYKVRLPAADQVVGRNRLVLRYFYHRAPAEVTAGSEDRRQLAVAWENLAFTGPRLEEDSAPVVTNAKGSLVLPVGSRADFFLDLPVASTLNISGVQMSGNGGALMRVTVLPDLGDESTVADVRLPAGKLKIPLSDSSGLHRLRLDVLPEGEHGAGWVAIGSPVIHCRLAEDEETQLHEAQDHDSGHSVSPRPNLIIYLVDALRADRLGCYGYPRPVSPRLDAFAREAIVFEHAVAQSSWTKAAVASIFIGVWPRLHGANGPEDTLPPALPTLPELLSEAGYRTAAVVANAYVNRPFGFARGFDSFTFLSSGDGASEEINERVFEWIDGHGQEPFFLYIHAIDPHAPYAAPEPFLSRFAGQVEEPSVGQVATVRGLVLGTVEPSPGLTHDLKALYDAEVARNDASFGAFLDRLEERGLYERSAVLFVSDHGEAFGEHGTFTHGIDLYSEVLSVPMVLRLPGGQMGGTRVPEVAQHIDVITTLLGIAGIDSASPGRGRDLLGPAPENAAARSYLDYWGRHGASVVTSRFKYIEPLSESFAPEPELYAWVVDPDETKNLARERPVVAGYLASQLRVGLTHSVISELTEIDDATRRELEALGYLR